MMEHIKTPVYEYVDEHWRVLYPVQPAGSDYRETFKSAGLYDQHTRLVALVPLLSQDAPDTVSELITALNAYDAHVARIAELEGQIQRQVDLILETECKLVEARRQNELMYQTIEADDVLHKHVRVCDAFDTPDGDCDTCLDLASKAQNLRLAALAQVRGEVGE